MKTKLTPLALLIPAVVLAQQAPQAPQPFQAVEPTMNRQVIPANAAGTPIPGAVTQTFPNTNKTFSIPLVNPIAVAAYSKAKARSRAKTGNWGKLMSSSSKSFTAEYDYCMKNYECIEHIYSDNGQSSMCVQWTGTVCHVSFV